MAGFPFVTWETWEIFFGGKTGPKRIYHIFKFIHHFW